MKCLVKIEAIECFPCYLKIAFYHEDDVSREYPISTIRINIPGVRIGSAASRTKAYTYGVFWKSNRKRCRLFLAFDDKPSCATHMKWLKQSIDSLEHYRKGMFICICNKFCLHCICNTDNLVLGFLFLVWSWVLFIVVIPYYYLLFTKYMVLVFWFSATIIFMQTTFFQECVRIHASIVHL